METTNTSNIPDTGFAVTNNDAIQERCLVRFNKSAMFTLSHFSLLQVLHGRLLLDKSYGMSVDTALAAKLGIYAIESNNGNAHIQLDRKEVQSLRLWLEARMRHCETERDERQLNDPNSEVPAYPSPSDVEASMKFNPDTYIAQKFLLLDIREWLLGDIID